MRKQFTYYCYKANVTKIRMYDLRHTYVATMMAEGKELYHISSRIGHNNYSTKEFMEIMKILSEKIKQNKKRNSSGY